MATKEDEEPIIEDSGASPLESMGATSRSARPAGFPRILQASHSSLSAGGMLEAEEFP